MLVRFGLTQVPLLPKIRSWRKCISKRWQFSVLVEQEHWTNADLDELVMQSGPSSVGTTSDELLSSILGCKRTGDWLRAVRLLLEGASLCSDRLPSLNAAHFSAAISACGHSSKWQEAAWLLAHEMFANRVAPNVVAFNAASHAYGLAGRWRDALDLIGVLKSVSLQPTTASFNCSIGASSRASRWESCLQVLHQMLSSSGEELPVPDMVTFGTVISSLERGQQAQRAIELLGLCRDLGLELNIVACNAALSACEKAQRWEKAVAILEEMRKGVWGPLAMPDRISHNAVISSCEKRAGHWVLALKVLGAMWAEGQSPDSITYNAAMATCEKMSQWEWGLALYHEMQVASLVPSVATLNAALGACEQGSRWREALQFLRSQCSNAASVAAVLRATEAAGVASVRKSLEEELRRRVGIVQSGRTSYGSLPSREESSSDIRSIVSVFRHAAIENVINGSPSWLRANVVLQRALTPLLLSCQRERTSRAMRLQDPTLEAVFALGAASAKVLLEHSGAQVDDSQDERLPLIGDDPHGPSLPLHPAVALLSAKLWYVLHPPLRSKARGQQWRGEKEGALVMPAFVMEQ